MRGRFTVLVLTLAGCAGQSLGFNEAEQHLVGRPETQVLECMGSPKDKHGDSYTSMWVYDYAEQACSLNIIFKGGYVSRVTTADASGSPLPEGQRCIPASLEWCAKTAPTPPTR